MKKFFRVLRDILAGIAVIFMLIVCILTTEGSRYGEFRIGGRE